MKKIAIFTLMVAVAFIAQGQKPSERTTTSIPSTSLDEHTVRTRTGALPTVAPRFSISINTPSRIVQAVGALSIAVTINNLTDQPIPWAPGYNDVRVTVKRGLIEAQRTALHRVLRGEPAPEDNPLMTSGSGITLLIPPHKSATQTLDLRQLYEFTENGDYAIIVQRYDDSSDVFVRSNVVTIRYSK